eukprot:1457119-Amphidinium_carterae.1
MSSSADLTASTSDTRRDAISDWPAAQAWDQNPPTLSKRQAFICKVDTGRTHIAQVIQASKIICSEILSRQSSKLSCTLNHCLTQCRMQFSYWVASTSCGGIHLLDVRNNLTILSPTCRDQPCEVPSRSPQT